MSDRLHDHDTIGLRRGCVACAQTEADLACGQRALAKTPRVGVALEHSIEDPFTGETSVTILLD